MDVVKQYFLGWFNDMLAQIQAAENRVFVTMLVILLLQALLTFLLLLSIGRSRRLNREIKQQITTEMVTAFSSLAWRLTSEHERSIRVMIRSQQDLMRFCLTADTTMEDEET